jgi:signal recognition particle subunit SRP68
VAQSTKTDHGPAKLAVDQKTLKRLKDGLKHLAIQTRAQAELQQAMQTNEQVSNMSSPLVERLGSYPEGMVDLKNLVTYPPKLQAVPVKPLFLDVAWNYIEYPGQTGQSHASKPKAATAEETKSSAKRGWFGFGGGS